jgi:predicted lipoprotein with Yx(FWY)xxD motif
MHARIGALSATVLTTCLVALAGCGGADDAAQPTQPAQRAQSAQPSVPATPNVPKSVTVKVSTTSLGPILTDQSGRTLYAFTVDKNGISKCADDCINVWPALISQTPVQAGEGTKAALFGKTERTEGTVQATYGDWPLYYYAGDVSPGDIDGQGVEGVWFVVGADGKLIRTQS